MNEAVDPLMGTLPQGFSFVELFLQADPVVKGVMVLLAFASVACWTVILEKSVRLALVRRDVRRFASAVLGGSAAVENQAKNALPGVIAEAAVLAWRDDDPSESRAERRERIERGMRGAMSAELKRLEWGLTMLATTGSAAPFIGLFGTVWGIMNAFSAIAASGDTSLAVVAPGIAEALFATAIGLVAAIPAVVAYNKFTTDLGRLSHRLGGSIASLGDRLARDRPLLAAAE